LNSRISLFQVQASSKILAINQSTMRQKSVAVSAIYTAVLFWKTLNSYSRRTISTFLSSIITRRKYFCKLVISKIQTTKISSQTGRLSRAGMSRAKSALWISKLRLCWLLRCLQIPLDQIANCRGQAE
jgi:hypothetical protein